MALWQCAKHRHEKHFFLSLNVICARHSYILKWKYLSERRHTMNTKRSPLHTHTHCTTRTPRSYNGHTKKRNTYETFECCQFVCYGSALLSSLPTVRLAQHGRAMCESDCQTIQNWQQQPERLENSENENNNIQALSSTLYMKQTIVHNNMKNWRRIQSSRIVNKNAYEFHLVQFQIGEQFFSRLCLRFDETTSKRYFNNNHWDIHVDCRRRKSHKCVWIWLFTKTATMLGSSDIFKYKKIVAATGVTTL